MAPTREEVIESSSCNPGQFPTLVASSEGTSGAYSSADKAKSPDIIVHLPKELQLDMFDFLGYQDAIRLSQVNRYFHNTVDPSKWPKEEKEDFVRSAQFWDKHNLLVRQYHVNDWPEYRNAPLKVLTDGYACSNCYRVRSRTAFCASQTTRSNQKSTDEHRYVGDTRSCIDCGIKHKEWRSGTVISVFTSECHPTQSSSHKRVSERHSRLFCEQCDELTEYEELVPRLRCPAGTCSPFAPYEAPFPGRPSDGQLAWSDPAQLRCLACSEVYEGPAAVTCRCSDCHSLLCQVCFGPNWRSEMYCSDDCALGSDEQWEKDMCMANAKAKSERLASQRAEFIRRGRTERRLAVSDDIFEDAEQGLLECSALAGSERAM